MDCFIGVDIGTSSVKALALGTGGETLGNFRQAYPAQTDAAGRHTEDPEVIFAATLNVVTTLIRNLSSHRPVCIAFSAAMHGLIALDDKGRLLTPLITWADTRSAREAAALKASPAAREIYRLTGTPIHPMSPLCKLLWLKTEHPGIFSTAAIYLSIKEYIWYRLFGVYEIDRSMASATGLFDTRANKWCVQALHVAGIRESQLSRPVAVTFSRQGVAPFPAIPFVIGAGDGCAANLGSGVVSPGEASVTIGTSGAVRVVTSLWKPEPEERLFQYWLTDNAYVRGGATNNGGNVLDWFKGLSANASLPEAFALPDGSDGLLFLPYLNGERAPIWDAAAKGAFVGLNAHHTPAHLLRAITEGVCFDLFAIFSLLMNETPIQTVYASGGFTRSEGWVQQLSDVFGKPVVLTEDDDASASGAALLGMLSLGVLSTVSDARRHIKKGKTYVPRAERHTLHQRYITLYNGLYPSLRDTMHELDQL